jgi:hypothetical protein
VSPLICNRRFCDASTRRQALINPLPAGTVPAADDVETTRGVAKIKRNGALLLSCDALASGLGRARQSRLLFYSGGKRDDIASTQPAGMKSCGPTSRQSHSGTVSKRVGFDPPSEGLQSKILRTLVYRHGRGSFGVAAFPYSGLSDPIAGGSVLT